MRFFHFALLFLVVALFLTGCAAPPPYVYRYVPGRTAVLENGNAIAPPSAPADVQTMIAAGNRIATLPYSLGGGHTRAFDQAYDCSGAVSFLLQAAGRLDSPDPSSAFRHFGSRGEGDWISIYARRGHVFAVVAGLRFDTSWTENGRRGPQWTTRTRPTKGFVIRHPAGL
jgi:hypothetical protein